MEMRVKPQVPRPGVKNGSQADRRPETPRVLPQLEQRFGRRLEKERKEELAVLKDERSKLRGQREDKVEVMGRENALLAGLNPACLVEALALGAVSVSARVVRGALEPAGSANVDVSPLCRRPARLDGAHGTSLLTTEQIPRSVSLAEQPEDMRDLKARTRV
jgi:hypothetical protein